MVEAFVTDTIVYASLFGLMALGLTLTYLTTKVPNFAYGSFVTIGMYTAFALYRIQKISPYASAPIAFALGAVASVSMYIGVLRILSKRGSSLVALMIATLAVDIAFVGIFGIYSDYLTSRYAFIDSKQFYPIPDSFTLFGTAGIVYVAPISLGIVTLAVFLLLTKSKLGVAMRASVENPSLARVVGINVERVYVFAWLLAGGFAAMSGSYYVLWLPGGITGGSNLIVEIFAASVLGGLASIYGSVLGGLIIGASEVLVTKVALDQLGSWVGIYQKGIPLIIMVVTLLVLPKGITSIDWHRMFVKAYPSFASQLRRLYHSMAKLTRGDY